MSSDDEKPISSGGEGGFGPGEGQEPEKSESGFKPKFEQKYKTEGEEKQEQKVTVYDKDWGKQQGYLGPGAGDFKHGVSGGFGYYEGSAKSELSVDLKKKELELDVVDVKGKAAVEHLQAKGDVDLGSMLKGLFGLTPAPPALPSVPSASAAPFAARVTDPTTHGSPLAPGIGSLNVMIGGLPAWRATMDFHACPIVKGVVPDVGGMVLVGCPTVMINSMMACRVGDFVVEIPGGPNPIIMGCPNVMIGTTAVGAPIIAAPPPKGTGFTAEGEAQADGLVAEASAKAAVEVKDGKALGVAKAGVMAAALKGSAKGTISIPLWGDHAIILGGSAEGAVVGIGAKASAEAGYTAEKGWHIGAEAGVTPGVGGSIGFSIGFK